MVMVSRSVVQKVSNLVFCARWTSAVISGRILRVNRPISYHSYNVQARSRVPGEIKRREVELDPQVIPEKIMSREVKLGCESWTSFASGCSSTAVQRTLYLWLPSTAAETATAQCTSRWAMVRGHRLNTSIVLAAVHGLSGLFSGGIRGRAFTLSPSSPMPPSLISHLASVDVKQHGQRPVQPRSAPLFQALETETT